MGEELGSVPSRALGPPAPAIQHPALLTLEAHG